MATRVPHAEISLRSNQENATSRLMGKSAMMNTKAQPVRRGALGDLGNRIHNLQNDTLKSKIMGPPVAMAKKNMDVTKKPVPVFSKENDSRKDKENTSKLQSRKPIRQESIIFQKPVLQEINKKIAEASKLNITEQTKDLVIYDPDEKTKDDPQMVTEYIQDILVYLKNIEDDFPIKEKFLEDSKITPKMRSTLVNWLVEAHQNFTMGLESLHLCISIVDRYIQVNKSVDRSIYQLVGTAALLLAAKYEEVYIPELEDFVFICDDAFTKKQILQMEIDIFKKLDFRLGWPLSIYFLRRYSKIAAVKADQHTLAKYILELALLEFPLAHIKPSIQAAAACCLSTSILTEVMDPAKVWTPTLAHYTKHRYSEFKPVVYEFAQMIAKAETNKFDAVRQKYSASKYGKISLNFKLQGPLIRKLSLSPILTRK